MSDKHINEGAGIEKFGYKQELKRGLTLRDVVLYGMQPAPPEAMAALLFSRI